MSASTVFIVDDSLRVLESTAAMLRSYGFHVETFDDPEEFLRELDPERPGVLLLDLRMPGVAGLDVLGRMRELGSTMPVLFLAAHAEIDQVVQAMRNGARDFLPKPTQDEDLVARLQEAAEEDARARAEQEAAKGMLHSIDALSRREGEVLDNVIRGWTNREIADALGICQKTAESHRGRVLKKLGAKNSVELTSRVLLAGYRPQWMNGSTFLGW
jgi:FixJ family two-component response regulator